MGPSQISDTQIGCWCLWILYIYILYYTCSSFLQAIPPKFTILYIIIVQTCGKRWELPKFVDVLSVNLVFSRLLICSGHDVWNSDEMNEYNIVQPIKTLFWPQHLCCPGCAMCNVFVYGTVIPTLTANLLNKNSQMLRSEVLPKFGAYLVVVWSCLHTFIIFYCCEQPNVEAWGAAQI